MAPIKKTPPPYVACMVNTKTETGRKTKCPSPARHELVRSCHGELSVSLVCAHHAEVLPTRPPGKCKPCETRTLLFVLVMPLAVTHDAEAAIGGAV